jgi:glyoxylase I family protein
MILAARPDPGACHLVPPTTWRRPEGSAPCKGELNMTQAAGPRITGYGVVLMDSRLGIAIGLHTNTANRGEAFDECRTGLDHISFGVADRDELAAWVARLDELGIQHTGIRDEKEPMPYSTVVFRDPDNIQLELIAFG